MQKDAFSSSPKYNDLKNQVLDKNLCCGCGSCAGICPTHALGMTMTPQGEYRPFLLQNCASCDLCLSVCPFNRENITQDEIGRSLFGSLKDLKFTPEVGFYDRCFVGWAPDSQDRFQGASGGLLTWTLIQLLESEKIDYVATVAATGSSLPLFTYEICSSSSHLRKCAKSAYYPVQLSDILKTICSRPGRYAVVALPCFAKAIRHLQENSALFRERVVYVLGLVCGKNKSHLYTYFLSRWAGMEPDQLTSVCYRDKTGTKKANDFFFVASNDPVAKRLKFSGDVSKLFCQPWFDLSSCSVCDDVFAECADAVFMDAWLPEYINDVRGTNLVVSRNENLSQILDSVCQSTDVAKVVQSQWGVVLRKRRFLRQKLAHADYRGGRPHLELFQGWAKVRPGNWLEFFRHRMISHGVGRQ